VVPHPAGAFLEAGPPGNRRTAMSARTHFYRDVPNLGHVAVSRHAQKRMDDDGISQEAFERALLTPAKPDVKEGTDIVWRERDGIRIVILEYPTPPTCAKLVKIVFRIKAQERAR
jgi:hypothetical protein